MKVLQLSMEKTLFWGQLKKYDEIRQRRLDTELEKMMQTPALSSEEWSYWSTLPSPGPF